jgi:hypothetical protein
MWGPDESLAAVIDRADEALYRTKGNHQPE